MSSICYKVLDLRGGLCYHAGMSELTITQTQKVIGWSYPTALQFAKQYGRQGGDGKWLIPFAAVAAEVQSRVIDAQKMQDRLVAVSGNGQHD